MKNVDQAFAIVRVDNFSVCTDEESLKNRIVVKEIVWSMEKAESEVDRLNALNRDKGAHYFWQLTRVVKRSRTAG